MTTQSTEGSRDQASGGWTERHEWTVPDDLELRRVLALDRRAEHVLLVVGGPDGDRILVDGIEHGPFGSTGSAVENALVVHPDTGRYACPVITESGAFVLVDGVPQQSFDAMSADVAPAFSPDGAHVAYGAATVPGRYGGEPALVVDGEVRDVPLAAAQVQFAPDGRLVYVELAPDGRRQRVVVGGEPGPWVDEVLSFEDPTRWTGRAVDADAVVFSRSSGSFAYAAGVHGGQVVLRDHVPGPVHESVYIPAFGGDRLTYVVGHTVGRFLRHETRYAVVVDDVAGPEFPFVAPGVAIRGGTVAYLAGESDAIARLHLDHEPSGAELVAMSGVHVTDSGRLWFVAGSGDTCRLVLDGVPGPGAPVVLESSVQESADGQHVGYLVGEEGGGYSDGGRPHLVLDGTALEHDVDDRFWPTGHSFSPDSRVAAIGVRAGSGMRAWVQDHPLGPKFEAVAGPWWGPEEVTFLGIRLDEVIRSTLPLG